MHPPPSWKAPNSPNVEATCCSVVPLQLTGKNGQSWWNGTPLRKLKHWPLRSWEIPKRKVIFQPSFFKGPYEILVLRVVSQLFSWDMCVSQRHCWCETSWSTSRGWIESSRWTWKQHQNRSETISYPPQIDDWNAKHEQPVVSNN